MLAWVTLFAGVVVMCALAAAAVLAAGLLLVLGILALTGLSGLVFPRRPARSLSFDDLRLSAEVPSRWRL